MVRKSLGMVIAQVSNILCRLPNVEIVPMVGSRVQYAIVHHLFDGLQMVKKMMENHMFDR